MSTYVNTEKLNKAIEWFASYVTYRNYINSASAKADFHSGYMEKEEGFKSSLFTNGHNALHLDSWTEEMIGTGKILKYVNAGMDAGDKEKKNIIVDHHSTDIFTPNAKKNMTQAESILYRLFKSEDIGTAFDEACKFWGRWFPELSYLLFIKDCTKFIPVKSDNHEYLLKKLGVNMKLRASCSWENYQIFLAIHEEVRQKLEECFGSKISLLDAHSFVWTLHHADDDLSSKKYQKTVNKQKGGAEYLNKVHLLLADKQKKAKESIQIEEALNQMNVKGEEREALVKVRVNQGDFRKALLARYKRCCLSRCGVQHNSLLIASHIKPWKDSLPEEKLDVNNGLLLCPNHDKLFDKGLISFTDKGKIIISKELSSDDIRFLNLCSDMQITVIEANKAYLEYHRQFIFADNKKESQ